MISFEFISEYIKSTINCIYYIQQLGQYEFNLSIGESMFFKQKEWLKGPGMVDMLSSIDSKVFGDIYAGLIP